MLCQVQFCDFAVLHLHSYIKHSDLFMYVWVDSFPVKQKNKTAIIKLSSFPTPSGLQKGLTV